MKCISNSGWDWPCQTLPERNCDISIYQALITYRSEHIYDTTAHLYPDNVQYISLANLQNTKIPHIPDINNSNINKQIHLFESRGNIACCITFTFTRHYNYLFIIIISNIKNDLSSSNIHYLCYMTYS
jgi:hypothetical protein